MNAFHIHQGWQHKLNTIVTAAVFIIVGLLFLGRNLGIVDPHTFHTLVSWQMLLIVIGIVQLVKRNLMGGLILIAIGSYFLFPATYGLGTYWPVFLILIGLGILFKLGKKKDNLRHHRDHYMEETVKENDGYVKSDVSFGGTKHIVLDPVFKGADLDVSFGSITLDLRRTNLENEIIYIDVDASFGGIELFAPSDWNILIEADTTMSGVQDKRLLSSQIDQLHKVIIRGDLTFSGIEIRS